MQFKIILLSILGFLFLILGAVGIFLPVWPTTPFVLLSVACFSSAPRIKNHIMKISFFKDHVENYEKRVGLKTKTVVISLLWLWIMMIISIILVSNILVKLLLFLIGIVVTVHILIMAKADTSTGSKS